MHLDPLALVFIPSAAVMVAAMVAPVAWLPALLLGAKGACGPSLDWWFGGTRWIALLIPGVGLGGAGWVVMRHVKRENQLARRRAMDELLDGEQGTPLLESGEG